jgi:prophage DNA circulation protein
MSFNISSKTASWRGIQFFYRSSTETGGFKTAEHLYPGSNNFKIEQLGKTPRRFNIECQVTKDTRDAFDVALGTAGSGVLVHPMYGVFICKMTQYTKDDNINELGLYTYQIEWVQEFGLIAPSPSTLSASVISKLRASGVENATTMIKEKLKGLGF